VITDAYKITMKIQHLFYNILLTVVICTISLGIYHYKLAPTVVQEESFNADYVKVSHNFVDRLRYSPDNFIRAAEKSTNSVVYIIAYNKVKGSVFSEGYTREKGSGVIISDDGYIVTNHHVIRDADFIEITLQDKREFVAEVIGTDESTDLALLKIESSNLPSLVFANSDSLMVGEWILAVGNPFGLQSTVTAGIVSAKARNIDALSKNDIESFIQSDAVINPGSSGGALVNTDGLLVGICTAIISSTGNYEGLSFAIPSNLAHKVIIDLKQFGSVQRGNLGITVTDVDAQIAEQYDMEIIKGVQIASVNLNSAAAESNLIKTDIILSIDNVTIDNSSEFYEQINRYRPGDQLQVEVYRRGRIMNFPITLRNHLNTTDYISVRSDKELRDIGIEIRDLNSIEKKRIQTSGIMVISISRGSKIDDTNMEPGFIVERVNGADIESAQQFMNILKSESGEITLVGFYERYPGRFPYTFMK